jgi:hypothetical protein
MSAHTLLLALGDHDANTFAHLRIHFPFSKRSFISLSDSFSAWVIVLSSRDWSASLKNMKKFVTHSPAWKLVARLLTRTVEEIMESITYAEWNHLVLLLEKGPSTSANFFRMANPKPWVDWELVEILKSKYRPNMRSVGIIELSENGAIKTRPPAKMGSKAMT